MSSVKLDTGGLAITQVAAVVRDLRSSLEAYHKALGWGPWNVYEHKPPMLHSTELHGKPTEFTMLGAECHAGPGRVRAASAARGAEHLQGVARRARRGPAPRRRDGARPTSRPDQTRTHFQELGAEVLMGGRIGETIQFYYLDTEPMLKVIFESGSGHAVDLKPSLDVPVAMAPNADVHAMGRRALAEVGGVLDAVSGERRRGDVPRDPCRPADRLLRRRAARGS